MPINPEDFGASFQNFMNSMATTTEKGFFQEKLHDKTMQCIKSGLYLIAEGEVSLAVFIHSGTVFHFSANE